MKNSSNEKKSSISDLSLFEVIGKNIDKNIFMAILDNVTIGITVINPKMEIVWFNKLFNEWFPYVKIQPGHYCYQFTYSCCKEDICEFCPTVNAIRTGGTYSVESGLCTNDKFYKLTAIPIKNEESEIICAVEISEDITEDKLTEEKLEESEKFFHTLAETSPVGIFYSDDKGNYSYINDQCSKIMGVPKKNALGNGWRMYLHPDDKELCDKEWLNCSKTKSAFNLEFRFLLPDGKITWVLGQSKPELNREGEVVGYVGTFTDITERKNRDEALRFFRFAIDNNADATYLVQSDGSITYVNNAACFTLGYSYDELVSMSVQDIDPDFPDNLWPEHWKDMKDAGTMIFEAHHKHKDGNVFPVEIQSTFLCYDGKEFICAYVRDITKRKMQEKHILQLSQAVEQSPASVIITDNHGCIEYTNPEFTKTSAYLFEEVVGKTPRVLKSGVQTDELYEKLWSTIKNGKEWKGRFCNKKKTGELYWEYQSINAIKEASGNITHFVAVKIDETERFNAEEEARKIERRFSRILEVSEDAIISIDIDQSIIIFNKGAERIFGYSLDEVVGKSIEILIPKRFRHNHSSHIKDFAKSDKKTVRLTDRIYQIFGLRKNGEEFPAEISISKYKEEGEMVFTAVLHDITERKEMEKEVLRAQKMESVGVLAGGIAHDFNNILTAVLSNTDLAIILSKKGQSEKTVETLLKIEKATIRARDLTQQLLTFAKGGTPVKKRFSIARLIKDSAEFATRGTNVKCEFFVPEDISQIIADEGQINQVINNLVINAMQAMPNGGVVTIRAENVDAVDAILQLSIRNKRHIKISIEDLGVGIKKEHIVNIFDPYFTTKLKGSGLGLASSYSIIKNHDGVITVESELGKGTTFFIYLPASLDSNPLEDRGDSKPLVGKGKILIMDDDEAIREVGSEMLGIIGYSVECAENGEEAIALYQKAENEGKPFDIVIMDLTVPGGMGGEATVKNLLKISPNSKSIVSSGYSNNPILDKYKDYGFVGVIRKPFEIKKVNGLLQQLINGG